MKTLPVALIVLTIAACSSDPDPEQQLSGSALPDPGRNAAGASANPAAAQHWRGIQSCSGLVDSMVLDTTSEETSITSYSKTATRVHVAGIQVGPSRMYSCGPLDFDGIVRSNSVSTMFESAMKVPCTSQNGTELVASGFGGDDLDQRSPSGFGAGNWNLDFSVSLREPEDPDAGIRSKVNITCKFELTLQ